MIGATAEVRSLVMTTESDVQSPGSEHADGDTEVALCGVCGHALSSHDPIAVRYCQASRRGALDRACACTIQGSAAGTVEEPTDSTSRQAEAPMYGRGRLSKT